MEGTSLNSQDPLHSVAPIAVRSEPGLRQREVTYAPHIRLVTEGPRRVLGSMSPRHSLPLNSTMDSLSNPLFPPSGSPRLAQHEWPYSSSLLVASCSSGSNVTVPFFSSLSSLYGGHGRGDSRFHREATYALSHSPVMSSMMQATTCGTGVSNMVCFAWGETSMQENSLQPLASAISLLNPGIIELQPYQISEFLNCASSSLALTTPAARPLQISLNTGFPCVWPSTLTARSVSVPMPGPGSLLVSAAIEGIQIPLDRGLFDADTSTASPEDRMDDPGDQESTSDSDNRLFRGNRLRSTIQMTSFLNTQIEQYRFFLPRTTREERLHLRNDWERALKDFNRKFQTQVSMIAFRRKISRLQRIANKRKTEAGTRKEASSGGDDEEAKNKPKRSKGSEYDIRDNEVPSVVMHFRKLQKKEW